MDYKNIGHDIIKKLIASGIDECDVFIVDGDELEIEVRLGNIEKLQQARSKALSIRTVKDNKTAVTYTSDFNTESINKLLEKTICIANITNVDDCNGLPNKDVLGKYDKPLNIYDDEIKSIKIDDKIKTIRELEDYTLSSSPLITNSDGSWWSEASTYSVMMNSKDFVGERRSTYCSYGIGILAESNGQRQKDYWYSQSRFYGDLEPVKVVGDTAANRTLRKLGAKKVKSQKVPVVFDPVVGADFLGNIADAISASSIWRKSSFLCDKLNAKVANNNANIIDDATLEKGLGSRAYDGEGVCSRKNSVIKNGILENYLCDTYSAKKMGMYTTANAGRSIGSVPFVANTNFFLENGNYTSDEIISSVKSGLYLTRLYWVGVNMVTGDYSRGAEGIWIENGKLTYPVQEITIASNMMEMLNNITMIGNDLTFRSTINSPTFLISEMSISGS